MTLLMSRLLRCLAAKTVTFLVMAGFTTIQAGAADPEWAPAGVLPAEKWPTISIAKPIWEERKLPPPSTSLPVSPIPLMPTKTPTVAWKPMTFRVAGSGGNCPDCQWIVADGLITRDTVADFKKFERAGPKVSMNIVLNSPGGGLLAGLALGRAIRAGGHWTAVGKTVSDGHYNEITAGVCMSACAFAFLGGEVRQYAPSVAPGIRSSLGFHQFYRNGSYASDSRDRDNDLAIGQEVSGLLVEYVAEMGVKSSLITLATSVNPDRIFVLSEQQASDLRVTTGRTGKVEWSLKPLNDGLTLLGAGSNDAHPFFVEIGCNANVGSQALVLVAISKDVIVTTSASLETFRQSIKQVTVSLDERHEQTISYLKPTFLEYPDHFSVGMPLTAKELALLRDRSLFLSVDAPMVFYGIFPDFELDGQSLRKIGLDAALRNCVH